MQADLRYELNPNEGMNQRKNNGDDLVGRLGKHYQEPPCEDLVFWRKRWQSHCKKKLDRFDNGYEFDMKGYCRSEFREEELNLLAERNEIVEAEKLNKKVREEFSEKLGKVKISKYALEKGDYFLQRFKELRKEKRINQSYELAFYLIGNNSTIDDAILGPDQKVTPTYCEIRGPIRKQLMAKGKQNIGWAHSHANFSTFYSSTDDNTMANSLNTFGRYVPLTNEFGGEFLARAFYGMVFNEAKDAHALRLIAKIPQFKIKNIDGKISWECEYNDVDFESTPSRRSNGRNLNNWLKEEVFDDGQKLTLNEKEEISQKILSDVQIKMNNGYKRLGDIEVKRPKPISRPKKSRRRKKGRSSPPKPTDKIGDKVKEIPRNETSNQISPSNLDAIIEREIDIKGELINLKRDFNVLKREYTALKKNYETLLPRVNTLESYRTAMQTYASQNDNIGAVAKILSGRGSWNWKDREKRLDCAIEILGKDNLKPLIPIIQGNRYLHKNHPEIFTRILKKLNQEAM
jgi:hypothetical protein